MLSLLQRMNNEVISWQRSLRSWPTQKAILNAFDMTSENVEKQARGISSDLARIRIEAAEAEAAKISDDNGGR